MTDDDNDDDDVMVCDTTTTVEASKDQDKNEVPAADAAVLADVNADDNSDCGTLVDSEDEKEVAKKAKKANEVDKGGSGSGPGVGVGQGLGTVTTTTGSVTKKQSQQQQSHQQPQPRQPQPQPQPQQSQQSEEDLVELFEENKFRPSPYKSFDLPLPYPLQTASNAEGTDTSPQYTLPTLFPYSLVSPLGILAHKPSAHSPIRPLILSPMFLEIHPPPSKNTLTNSQQPLDHISTLTL